MFEEGSALLREHVERERNASLRNAALKAHGAKCSHPGCMVTELHKLDVHHTKPIALGQRKSSVHDVAVLCKNHHAEAHYAIRRAELDESDRRNSNLKSWT
jgi:predicted HNH restriction endonuclease